MKFGSIEVILDDVYVDGKKTKNPFVIGLAMLDAVENKKTTISIESAKSALITYLKKNKLRQTSERMTLLRMVQEINHAFDAEALYQLMKEKKMRVCRSTVYNNLDIFLKCKIIKQTNDNGFTSAQFKVNSNQF